MQILSILNFEIKYFRTGLFMIWLIMTQQMLDWLYIKIVNKIDTRLIVETVEIERLFIEIVIINNIDGIDKYKEIVLL